VPAGAEGHALGEADELVTMVAGLRGDVVNAKSAAV
jgi:hypothetical protein